MLTLEHNVISLCKSIIQSDIRNEFQNVIKKINQRVENDSSHHMGYLLREFFKNSSCQFLCFILESKKMDTFDHLKKEKEEIIDGKDYELILNLHHFFLKLIDGCLETVRIINPNFIKAIHPYSNFEYRFTCNNLQLIEKFESENENLINEIINSFQIHNAIDSLNSMCSNERGVLEIASEIWFNEVLKCKSLLIRKGVFDYPLELKQDQYERSIVIREILFKLVSLKSSLKVMLQLLYQSFLFNKLKIVDENNTFRIKRSVVTIIGESMEIYCDWNNFDGFSIKPSEVIKVNLKLEKRTIDGIYIVNNCNSSLKDGGIVNLVLRKINNDLSYLF